MKRFRGAATIVGALAGLAILAGCGASTSSGGSGGGNSSAAPGVSKNQIVIGTSMGLTGPTAAEAQAALNGARTYFNYVNAHGGVNGRKIKLIALDDGFKSPQTVLNTRRLVSQDHVFSLFYVWGLNNTLAILPYVKQTKIPLIGPQAPTSAIVKPTLPNVFLMLPTFYDEGAICSQNLAASSSVHKQGILYENDAIGQDGLDGFNANAKQKGVAVGARVAFTSGSPSFTGQITQLRNAGVTGLTIFGTNPDIVNIGKGIAASGWKPTLCASSNVFDPTFLKLDGQTLGGLIGSLGQYLPESSEPAVVTYRQQLHQYFPSTPPTIFGVQAYGEAELFVQALKQAGKNPTWTSLESAFNGFNNVKTGMLFPVSFSASNHDGLSQYRMVEVKSGAPAFTSPFQDFSAVPH